MSSTILKEADRVMTICNTGGLATVERGTALAVIQGTTHASHSLVHIIYRSEWQDMLPVDLSPEGNLALVELSQSLNVHAEQL